MAERPVFDQVNLVVRDMPAMVAFYERLGLPLDDAPPPWDRHHRTFDTAEGLDLDLDSAAFASVWDTGWREGASGPVLGFRLSSRVAVDELYAELTGAGYVGHQEPYDAFFGARYALVEDPDGNVVGLMSPRDPALASAPPDVSDL